MTTTEVTLRINGQDHRAEVEPRLLLVDFIRTVARLTGTHVGCETTNCGACTVHLDGRAVKACTMFAVQAEGSEVRTIEGVADGDRLHPVQQAFHEHHALQCGFCTPGMVMSSLALLAEDPKPSCARIREQLSGNVCRCTGYQNIVNAVASVAAGSTADGAAAATNGGQA